MKKRWNVVLWFLFGILFLFPGQVFADELGNLVEKYALTGEELDKFEQQEQKIQNTRSSVVNYDELYENYVNFKAQGIFGDEVSFEMFLQEATTPAPSDPVDVRFRSVAGSPQPGDIMITNGTSFLGVTGHAGIFIGNGKILSIGGGGEKPSEMPIINWMQRYKGWTKIYRPAAKFNPKTAERWAINNYRNKNISYAINNRIFEKNPTYCSKIVWQAYYYSSASPQTGLVRRPLFDIVYPYTLPNLFSQKPVHVATWNS
ncbi:YiiX/YebB-like N1pC/P60 family cysteine hydrolase [Enterococcus termitis]|uniref:NlpC/P60 domain-containing protein n=1 Tax=Enterococcus termitis TaxID=332950 RepID=A0A1E5G977_9ENTE|nr:YiiX/YebB-like N1pC/P60 family cysteine hydrolase [Enterococcus termitis]OEG09135.1 hypothetical protein BCR25_11230 [Enterococcus termitis]OJG98592.1 hypothetical protein RV18_GL003015 [Enterococcus termitis]